MSFYKNRPIPLLEAGPERELMARILFGVKRIKGLTTALVKTAGVNAKWLNPDERKQSFTTLNNRIYWHYAKLKN